MKGNPVKGFRYLLRGFSLITRPGLRLFVLVPLLINTLIFGAFIYATLDQFSGWIEATINWLPSFLDFLRWVLWPLAVILILAVVTYTFSIIANLIASPFNGLLAEKTEELLSGKEVPGFETLGQALMMFPKSLARECSKLFYYIPLALLVLILSFIPGINFLAPALWFLLGSWMMVIQYCDFPMDNNQQPFRRVKTIIAKQRMTSVGFGMGVMAGTMIPGLNFLIMPAAVCGATAYWVDELEAECQRLQPPPGSNQA